MQRWRATAADVLGRHEEKARFLVVGAWNVAFSLAVLWLLERAIPHDPGSALQKEAIFFLDWLIAVTQNFFTFKLLVFRTRGNWIHEYGRMYVTYAATFVVQSALMQALSAWLGWSIFLATVPTVFIVTVLSYLGHKHFTFAGRDVLEGVDPAGVFEPGGAERPE
jgi:putative flippase GtrA